MKNCLPLTQSELAVMEYLWQLDASEESARVTAKQILEQLYSESEKSQHGTIQRLLKRLEEKGYIRRDKSIAVHFFEPCCDRNSFLGGQLKALADQYCEGCIAPMIENLLGKGFLLENDIVRLKILLNEVVPQAEQERPSPPPLKVDSSPSGAGMDFPTLPNVKGN